MDPGFNNNFIFQERNKFVRFLNNFPQRNTPLSSQAMDFLTEIEGVIDESSFEFHAEIWSRMPFKLFNFLA